MVSDIKPEIRAMLGPFSIGRSIDVLISCLKGGKLYVLPRLHDFWNDELKSGEWKEQNPVMTTEASLSLPWEGAQQLMDDLWHAGLRPSQARAGNDVINAKDKHLEDMRMIAFKFLELNKDKK